MQNNLKKNQKSLSWIPLLSFIICLILGLSGLVFFVYPNSILSLKAEVSPSAIEQINNNLDNQKVVDIQSQNIFNSNTSSKSIQLFSGNQAICTLELQDNASNQVREVYGKVYQEAYGDVNKDNSKWWYPSACTFDSLRNIQITSKPIDPYILKASLQLKVQLQQLDDNLFAYIYQEQDQFNLSLKPYIHDLNNNLISKEYFNLSKSYDIYREENQTYYLYGGCQKRTTTDCALWLYIHHTGQLIKLIDSLENILNQANITWEEKHLIRFAKNHDISQALNLIYLNGDAKLITIFKVLTLDIQKNEVILEKSVGQYDNSYRKYFR